MQVYNVHAYYTIMLACISPNVLAVLWYLDAQSILSMWSGSDVLLQLVVEVGGVCNSAQQKCCCMSMFVHSRSLSFLCVNVSVLF